MSLQLNRLLKSDNVFGKSDVGNYSRSDMAVKFSFAILDKRTKQIK